MKSITSGAGALLLWAALAPAAAAQESVAGGGDVGLARPGWTLTPGFTLSSTYDDNVTLFGRGSADDQNNDTVSTYAPYADLSYRGRRTRVAGGYAGSFLDYRTFSVFNRWQQRAHTDLRHQVNQRLEFSADGSASVTPTTEWVDLGGIPFTNTGARVVNAQAGGSYRFDARNAITQSVGYQNVRFERTDELRPYLRGGRALFTSTAYRRTVSSRLGLGADYGFRRSAVVDDLELVNLHTAAVAGDYQLTAGWALQGGAGLVMLEATATSASEWAPAYRAATQWRRSPSTFRVSYSRTFMPSFGIGGTVQAQDLGISYRTNLFRSRRIYVEQSAMFRDSVPLLEGRETLRLRSFRSNSVIGWTPQPWVRIQGFFSRTDQTSLLAGGRVQRNRVGIQIVTSRPVRMQ